jgi:intraflagellar transport protein 81
MKAKHGSKPEMNAMLVPTSQLRKEQEEEVRISEKIQSYRNQLENAENQLMSLQQSLNDAKKSLSPNNSPEQMLHAIKNEVRKNREIVKERMTVEYNERMKKLQQTEKMLAEPPITQNELMMLENTMTALRRAVTQMEERLSKETSKDDKLAIYKGQAALVTKKKEQNQEALKREEEDMTRL